MPGVELSLSKAQQPSYTSTSYFSFWCWKHLAGVESTSLADFIGDLTRANWESLTGSGVEGGGEESARQLMMSFPSELR